MRPHAWQHSIQLPPYSCSFVMRAWATSMGVDTKEVKMLADSEASLHTAMGELTKS